MTGCIACDIAGEVKDNHHNGQHYSANSIITVRQKHAGFCHESAALPVKQSVRHLHAE